MLIGLLGGSFNPLHLGHIAIARALIQKKCVERVWLMVSPQNPLKAHEGLLSEATRYEMAVLGAEGEEGIEASDFEFHLPRPSYTITTLQALQKAYPQHRFALIIGSDNWLIFDRWHRAAEILHHYPIFIYPRPSYEVKAQTLPAGVQLIECKEMPVSSTALRAMIARGEDAAPYLPPKVWTYIKERGLYRKA